MKILHIENIVANNPALKKIELPTDQELKLASFNTDGKSLLKYWFEFGKDLQNTDGSKIRNRSGAEVFNALDQTGSSIPSVVRLFNGSVMTTKYRSYADLPWDSPDYTLFAVLKVASDIATGTNTSLVGQNNSADGSVNSPCLNIGESGLIRVLKTGNTTVLASTTDVEIKSKLKLVTVTQSTANGTQLRVNKETKQTNTNATAKEAGSCKSLKILGGSTTLSANFNGDVAAIIICPVDLTNTNELSEIESYLFDKYCQ